MMEQWSQECLTDLQPLGSGILDLVPFKPSAFTESLEGIISGFQLLGSQ